MSPALMKILADSAIFLIKLVVDLATGKTGEAEAIAQCQAQGIHVVEGDSDAELAAYEDLD